MTIQCQAGLSAEDTLEQLGNGSDATLTNLARMIGSAEGIAKRLEKLREHLNENNNWTGESASLAVTNLGVMQRNYERFARRLEQKRQLIQAQNDARRAEAWRLHGELPSGLVPSYVHDALSRDDKTVWIPFAGEVSLDKGAEAIENMFGNNRENAAAEKLVQMAQFVQIQAAQVKATPDVAWEKVKLRDGSEGCGPQIPPPPSTYTPTIPPYPGTNTPSWPEPKTPSWPTLGDGGGNGGGGNGGGNGSGGGNGGGGNGGGSGGGGNTSVDSGMNGGGGGTAGLGVGLAGGGLGAAGIAAGAKLAGFGGLGAAGFGAGGAGAGVASGGLRGSGGLAGGASGSGAAAGSGSGSGSGAGGRGGGMMGGAGAGGSDEKKKKGGAGLGYLAPKFEDEGDGGPAADASRAGSRSDD